MGLPGAWLERLELRVSVACKGLLSEILRLNVSTHMFQSLEPINLKPQLAEP